ncbi:hypothetical protein [Massilia sp. DWR3-1-1]|uniref:hypothetical protein n=1 Tax=Massilia sp. DWR3-1-1 TaxID=2804559 RepID=UPI003CFB0A04
MAVSRRTFLTTGGLAALALAVCGGAYRYHQRAPAPFVAGASARAILDAIIPAMLAGALTERAQIAPTRARVLQAIAGLPLSAQQEIDGLFTLLALGPVRRLLAGVPADWDAASPAQVAAFLQSWRLHRFADLQVAYAALHDLILGAWYADPSSWAAIGYPGPLAALSQ